MANKEEVLKMLEAIDGGTYYRRDLLEVFKSMVEALGFAPEPEPTPEPAPEPAPEPEANDDAPNFSNG
jgi:hypothetical protein|tara:strand:- start:100 stop:303 length:204 start_codon:yes stop_codon:yes gene_type:complete